jgi:hypothetical protein
MRVTPKENKNMYFTAYKFYLRKTHQTPVPPRKKRKKKKKEKSKCISKIKSK